MPGKLREVTICPTSGYAWNTGTSVGPQFRREAGKPERARPREPEHRARGRGCTSGAELAW